MADYISKFTGQQIDAAIQKATDIAKTATDINSNLAYTEGLKTNLNTIADNEIVSKKSDGSLQGTGIINESDKIFFPKDGRFPSASIDIGPAATISENGGWLQYTANTLGKKYILLDYENDETGSKRPIYWERAAEEKGHIVNNVDSTAMNNITTFNYIPTANSQVNALYLNFATDVSNFMAEIVSLNTGKSIKYIPNENAWKTNVGGLNLASGVRNILQNISPISLLTAYNLKINFKANNPINLKGDGTKPYLMVDRQLITAKPIALEEELNGGGGGSDTASQIRDKLQTLTGADRLNATAIQGIEGIYTNLDGGTLKTDVEGINPSPVSQCWVSTDGLDTNNGGINKPFKTIQKALDGLYGLINVLPGTFTEDLNIPVGYGQYAPVISCAGTFESPKTFIRGTLNIPAGVSRLRIKNVLLDGKSTGPAIIDNGSDGRHILENVTVSNPATNGDLITVVNGNNWWNIEGSAIEGKVNLSGTGNNAMFNIINSPNSFLCTPVVNNGYTFTAFYVGKIGLITHNGGNVFVSYAGSWLPTSNKIINSTSVNPLDIIGVGYSSFTADLVNYGTISSVGATVIKNYNAESLYTDVCLSAVSTVASTLITTTASTLIAATKKVERNISYNTTNGELTFTKTGSYNVDLTIKIDCTEWNKKVETWIEKYNTTNSAWEVVADSGYQRMFQTDQEVEIKYNLSSYFTAGDKYRLRAISDSDTTISAKTITLSNNVKMPAIRLSIYA